MLSADDSSSAGRTPLCICPCQENKQLQENNLCEAIQRLLCRRFLSKLHVQPPGACQSSAAAAAAPPTAPGYRPRAPAAPGHPTSQSAARQQRTLARFYSAPHPRPSQPGCGPSDPAGQAGARRPQECTRAAALHSSICRFNCRPLGPSIETMQVVQCIHIHTSNRLSIARQLNKRKEACRTCQDAAQVAKE